MEQENLEKKITFWDRAKYASIPAVLTAGSCFIPELKKKYSSLSEEKRDTCKTVALASTTLFGAIVSVASGYNLFKDYKAKKEREMNIVVQ